MDSRKLRYSLVMLMALIAFGTIGYYLFERMSFFDAFYMKKNWKPEMSSSSSAKRAI